jgi:hypothetical protein
MTAHDRINKMLIFKDCACRESGGSLARNCTTKSLCERDWLPLPVAECIDSGDPLVQIPYCKEGTWSSRELRIS